MRMLRAAWLRVTWLVVTASPQAATACDCISRSLNGAPFLANGESVPTSKDFEYPVAIFAGEVLDSGPRSDVVP